MGIGDFLRKRALARDMLNSDVYAVIYILVERHGWSEHCAREFCMKDKFNYKRILQMRNVFGLMSDNIADQIHAGAIASDFSIV